MLNLCYGGVMTLSELKLANGYSLLTIRQMTILFLLTETQGMKLHQVSKHLGIPSPSVTRAYDRLCQEKLLKRHRGENDLRDVFGVPTERGRELVNLLGMMQ